MEDLNGNSSDARARSEALLSTHTLADLKAYSAPQYAANRGGSTL
jgi:hypothetical protein